MTVVLVLIAIVCMPIGGILGSHRGSVAEGVAFGLLGPLGILALVVFRPRLTPSEVIARREAAQRYMGEVRK